MTLFNSPKEEVEADCGQPVLSTYEIQQIMANLGGNISRSCIQAHLKGKQLRLVNMDNYPNDSSTRHYTLPVVEEYLRSKTKPTPSSPLKLRKFNNLQELLDMGYPETVFDRQGFVDRPKSARRDPQHYTDNFEDD
jgi:hypothetical protein